MRYKFLTLSCIVPFRLTSTECLLTSFNSSHLSPWAELVNLHQSSYSRSAATLRSPFDLLLQFDSRLVSLLLVGNLSVATNVQLRLVKEARDEAFRPQ